MLQLLGTTPPKAEWQTELPATPDFQRHRTFVTPPMTGRGLWLVVASAAPTFADKDNRVSSVALLLGNLVLVSRAEPSAVAVRAVYGDSGRPARGVEVRLYSRDWNRSRTQEVASLATDSDGTVRFDYDPAFSRRSLFLVGLKDGDIALDGNAISMEAPKAPAETSAALVYTDRAIYRPSAEGPLESGRVSRASGPRDSSERRRIRP